MTRRNRWYSRNKFGIVKLGDPLNFPVFGDGEDVERALHARDGEVDRVRRGDGSDGERSTEESDVATGLHVHLKRRMGRRFKSQRREEGLMRRERDQDSHHTLKWAPRIQEFSR